MKRQKHEADEKHGKNPQAKQMKNQVVYLKRIQINDDKDDPKS